MKLQCSRYQLTPIRQPNAKSSQAPRHGFYLRLYESEDNFGVCDIMPWPELGDPSLEELLKLFQSHFTRTTLESTGEIQCSSALVSRGFELMIFDKKARSDQRSLCVPESASNTHYEWSEAGQVFKIKLNGSDPEAAIPVFNSWIQKLQGDQTLRLDFNGSIPESLFGLWSSTLKPHADQIDFVEDPFSSSLTELERFSVESGVPVALDWWPTEMKMQWTGPVIWKPTREGPPWRTGGRNSKRIVVTSALESGFGVAVAEHFASQFPKETHGVDTSSFYESHPSFSPNLKHRFGFGFEDHLSSLIWEDLGHVD